jgi:dTDP-4-dehydrorhamnose 3,5-epimerase
VLYKVDAGWQPGDEFGIRWDDPDVAIGWPTWQNTRLLSAKDSALPVLRDATEATLPHWTGPDDPAVAAWIGSR